MASSSSHHHHAHQTLKNTTIMEQHNNFKDQEQKDQEEEDQEVEWLKLGLGLGLGISTTDTSSSSCNKNIISHGSINPPVLYSSSPSSSSPQGLIITHGLGLGLGLGLERDSQQLGIVGSMVEPSLPYHHHHHQNSLLGWSSSLSGHCNNFNHHHHHRSSSNNNNDDDDNGGGVNGMNKLRPSSSSSILSSCQIDSQGLPISVPYCDQSHHHNNGVWFTLRSSTNRSGEALPQIPKAYIRVRDENMTVLMVKRYLVRKLGLSNETEIDISCMGESLSHILTLKQVRDAVWIPRLIESLNSTTLSLADDSHDISLDHIMSLLYRKHCFSNN